jgi:hypothetical protein
MATIITRETGATAKGSPLTNAEVDANFINLNTEITPSRPAIRPSLNLDFAKSQAVDSRISFTRASAATHYDGTGTLITKHNNQPRINFDPNTGECKGLLIEEQRTNSNTFYNGYNLPSTEYGLKLTPNAIVAPDGTKTGFLARPDGSSTSARILAVIDGAGTWTTSIYAKQAASNSFSLWIYSGGWLDTGGFTWNNGVLTSDVVSTTRTITNVGNGWWRVTVTYTAPASGSIIISAGAYGDGTNTSASTYFWGLQTEQGSFATSYIQNKTTFLSRSSSATYTNNVGVVKTAGANQPRYGYGYDSASKKWISEELLLENASSNLLPNSVNLSSWASTYGGTITSNAILSPDNLNNGSMYTSANGSIAYIYLTGGYTAGQIVTYSGYAKPGNTDYACFRVSRASDTTYGEFGLLITFSSESATPWTTNAGVTISASVQKLPNGWYKFSVTGYVPNATNYGPYFFGANSSSGSVAGNTVYVWGLQLEAGLVATSYIPTYGSSVTRSADVYTSTATTRAADEASLKEPNFSSWFKPQEGSFVIEANNELLDRTDTGQRLFTLSDGTTDNTIRPYINSSEAVVYFMSNGGGTATIITGSSNAISGNSPFKVALAYKSGDHGLSVNGSIQTSSNSALPLVFNKLDIAKYHTTSNMATCHIKRLAYYRKRLSNTELQALTA